MKQKVWVLIAKMAVWSLADLFALICVGMNTKSLLCDKREHMAELNAPMIYLSTLGKSVYM